MIEYQLTGESVKPPTAMGKLFPNVKVHQYILALIHSKQFIKFLAPDLNVKNLKFGITVLSLHVLEDNFLFYCYCSSKGENIDSDEIW